MHTLKCLTTPWYSEQPERYLKDGKLNPDVRDPDSAVFGFGRRSVYPTFSPIHAVMESSPVYVLEGT